jgi:hypothetical protein
LSKKNRIGNKFSPKGFYELALGDCQLDACKKNFDEICSGGKICPSVVIADSEACES